MGGVCDPTNPNFQFDYCPSLAPAILFTVLFGFALAGHIFLAWHYRKPFCWVLIMGAAWEFISFVTRIVSINSPYNNPVGTTTFVFLVLAPLWINAFDYMVLGRLVYMFLPDRKLAGIRGSRMTIIFVSSDITSFLIQLVGALFTLSNNATSVKNGLHVYTAGVCIQETVILVFLVLGVFFWRRLKTISDVTDTRGAFRLTAAVFASLSLITFRIIFRILEFSAGANSTLRLTIDDNEFYMYVFDATPMFFALCIFLVYHPGRVLRGEGSEYPKRTKEEKRMEKEEKKRIKVERKEEKARMKAERA